ncbi:MAG: D-tyrosyl-tRNA(Tyr) deacylase [Ruminococcaceae bacterium]|nr:D-tyrosyl-tRNA(Tyr) deacylase [Oscillospiraceae bacterium]
MKAVLQRVSSASVSVDGVTVGECGRGLMILLGVAEGDTWEDGERLLQKIVKLRIFEDGDGKMNRSVTDVGGELLVISQFTLLANYRRGNRPDFISAAHPYVANELYERFCREAENYVSHVGRGIFGADMKVSLVNDGPVTIVMDSDVLKSPKN